MILSEVTGVPSAALPITQLRDHLRLGSGFSDDAVQDTLLEGYLRAALSAVEARTGKAVIARTLLWVLEDWGDPARVVLPTAPISAIASVTIKDRTGVPTLLAPASYLLIRDAVAPVLAGVGASLPALPDQGTAEVVFTAGFGAWAAVPPDLAQAVMLLAAHYHENRHAADGDAAGVPFGVTALIERWRPLRIGGGRA